MASPLLLAIGAPTTGDDVIWLAIPLIVLAMLTKPIADLYLHLRDRMAYRALLRDARRTLRRSARQASRRSPSVDTHEADSGDG